jgi:type I restriction enzyme S subunit
MKAMEGWIDIKIRDFFSSSTPGDWGKDGNQENGVPVLRSTNFCNNGSIDYSDIAYREVDEASLKKRRVDKGTILIEKSGGSPSQAAGRVVYCDREFSGTASNFIEVVKVKDAFSSRYVAFLLYYLYQIGVVLKYQQQTTGIINFKLNEYSEEMVNYPAFKPEQTKIAEILSTVDRAIEQTEALSGKRQRIKTGLMQDLLTRGIDEHGNLRSEKTHKFKDSPMGRIPEEWQVKPLGGVIGIIDCKHYTPAYVEEGIPVIRPRNIKDFGFDFSDIDYVTNHDFALLTGRHQPRATDIVFSRNASFGVPVYVEGTDRFCIGQDVVVMTQTSVNTKFVFFALKSERVTIQIANVSGGSTFGRINLCAIRTLKVALPESAHEQQAITERLVESDEPARIAAAELQKLRSLKTALMHDLLTGKKRVTALLADTGVTN